MLTNEFTIMVGEGQDSNSIVLSYKRSWQVHQLLTKMLCQILIQFFLEDSLSPPFGP